jgi:hypothetical protein
VLTQAGLVNDDFEFMATREVRFAYNAEAGLLNGEPVSTSYRSFGPYGEDFVAGNFLDFCSTLPSTMPTTIMVRHVWSNTLVYETTLNAIQVCA